MPCVKQDIDNILFWKERHYSVIQSFRASKNNGAATPIRHARKALGSIMKTINKMDGRLQKMREADEAFARSITTRYGVDVDDEIAKKLQSEAQVHCRIFARTQKFVCTNTRMHNMQYTTCNTQHLASQCT